MSKEVALESVNGAMNDRIDEAYRAKYNNSPYLKPMVGLSATLCNPKDYASRN